jgi:hypothetical protein
MNYIPINFRILYPNILEQKLKNNIDSKITSVNISDKDFNIKSFKQELKKEILEEIMSFKSAGHSITRDDLSVLDTELRKYYNENIKRLFNNLENELRNTILQSIPKVNPDSSKEIDKLIIDINKMRTELSNLYERIDSSGLYKFSSRIDKIETSIANTNIQLLQEEFNKLKIDYMRDIDRLERKIDLFINTNIDKINQIPNILNRLDNYLSKSELEKILLDINNFKIEITQLMTRMKTVEDKITVNDLLKNQLQDLLKTVDEKISNVLGPLSTRIDDIDRRLKIMSEQIEILSTSSTKITSENLKVIDSITNLYDSLKKTTTTNFDLLNNTITNIESRLSALLGKEPSNKLSISDIEKRLSGLEQYRDDTTLINEDYILKLKSLSEQIKLLDNKELIKSVANIQDYFNKYKHLFDLLGPELDEKISNVLKQITISKDANDKIIQESLDKLKKKLFETIRNNINTKYDSAKIEQKISIELEKLIFKMENENNITEIEKQTEYLLINPLLTSSEKTKKQYDNGKEIRRIKELITTNNNNKDKELKEILKNIEQSRELEIKQIII